MMIRSKLQFKNIKGVGISPYSFKLTGSLP